MALWYVVLFCIAGFGAMAAGSGGLVVATSMLTLGLMIPVWMVLANAWWMLGLLAPWVFLAQFGGPVSGLLAMLLCAGGGWLWLTSEIDAARARVLPTLVAGEGLAPSDRPLGVEVEGGCTDLCLDLLSGPDLAWLRLGDGLTWRRAPEAACRALDPERAPGPCILASPADTAPADLRIEVVSQNPGLKKDGQAEDLVRLSALQVVTLTGPDGLHLREGSAILSEAEPPFFVPASSWPSGGIDSSIGFKRTSYLVDAEGRQPGFAMLPIPEEASAKPTRRVLARAGVEVGTWPGFEAATLISMASALEGRRWPPTLIAGVGRWIEGLRTRPPQAAWQVLRQVPELEGQLRRLRTAHPDWFAP